MAYRQEFCVKKSLGIFPRLLCGKTFNLMRWRTKQVLQSLTDYQQYASTVETRSLALEEVLFSFTNKRHPQQANFWWWVGIVAYFVSEFKVGTRGDRSL